MTAYSVFILNQSNVQQLFEMDTVFIIPFLRHSNETNENKLFDMQFINAGIN